MRTTFVIGNSLYDAANLDDLPLATNDADAMFALLEDPAFGSAERSERVADATRREFLSKLGGFLNTLSSDDELVFYFAGHGGRLPSGGLTLLCRDSRTDRLATSSVSYKEIQRMLQQSPCKRSILIFDCCFARSVTEYRSRMAGEQTIEHLIDSPPADGQILMWGCGASELAYENNQHGLFTSLLIEALNNGAGLSPDIRLVKPADVISWIQKKLSSSKDARHFTPGMRISGSAEGLYLAKNPLHSPSYIKPSEEALDGRLSLLLSKLGVTQHSPDYLVSFEALEVARLECIKKARTGFWKSSSYEEKDDEVFIKTTTWRLIKSFMGTLFVPTIFVAIIVGFFSDNEELLQYSILFCFLVSGCIAITLLIKRFRSRHSRFVLATRDGIVISCGPVDSVETWITIPWELITEHYYLEKTGQWDNVTHYLGVSLEAHNEYIEKIFHPTGNKDWSLVDIFEDEDGNVTDIQFSPFPNLAGDVPAIRSAIEYSKRFHEYEHMHPVREGAVKESEEASSGSDLNSEFALVGVSEYTHLPNLSSPEEDIKELNKLWIKAGGLNAQTCLDPSLARLEDFITSSMESASEHILTIHFSGHGLVDHGTLYLMAADSIPGALVETALAVERIVEMAFEHRLTHLILIFDCCFSGASGEAIGTDSRSLHLLEEIFDRDRDLVSVMAATGRNEPALENASGGLFSQGLSLCVKKLMDTESNITLNSLDEPLTSYMKELGLEQRHHIFADQHGLEVTLIRATAKKALTKEEIRQSFSEEAELRSTNQKSELKRLLLHFKQGELKVKTSGEISFPDEPIVIPAAPKDYFTTEILPAWFLFLIEFILLAMVILLLENVSEDPLTFLFFLALFAYLTGNHFRGLRAAWQVMPICLILSKDGIAMCGNGFETLLPAIEIDSLEGTETREEQIIGSDKVERDFFIRTVDGRSIPLLEGDSWSFSFDAVVEVIDLVISYYQGERKEVTIDHINNAMKHR